MLGFAVSFLGFVKVTGGCWLFEFGLRAVLRITVFVDFKFGCVYVCLVICFGWFGIMFRLFVTCDLVGYLLIAGICVGCLVCCYFGGLVAACGLVFGWGLLW